ncbi:UPF0692 protein C19orf54 homolog [Elysia marginata]|uniref:Actin maturation protease n=1 Tax=Elysia marginata TaxID=1093978 RepID=A0AAV4FM82_9GAST|nr:UPF0692 protein C19orf54 homolog [Elysia marginata]
MSGSEAGPVSSISDPPPLPPPPPPPLSAPVIKRLNDTSDQREQSKGQIVGRPVDCLSPFEQSRKAFRDLHLQGLLTEGEDVVLSCYNPIKPVLQNGPVCGLVALSMASQLTNENHASPDAIFSEAQKQGFSKQGEMFSVSHMKELSSYFLECPVKHLILGDDAQPEKSELLEIITHLLLRNVLLVPYDADKNHSPCLRKGHKAHWAVITGIFVAFPGLDSPPINIKTACEMDTEIPSLCHWPEHPPLSLCKDLASFVTDSLSHAKQNNSSSFPVRLYVYGHQGKSKHARLWNLSELLQSNAQLEESGPQRDTEDYVIPMEGVASGLKSQMLIVKRRFE